MYTLHIISVHKSSRYVGLVKGISVGPVHLQSLTQPSNFGS